MLYHASPTAGIKTLTPRISNHGEPLIYFSEKRENTLVYLSNAVEKYCRQTGFKYSGAWEKWATYGFKEGKLILEEYYPNASELTYSGVSGYIYSVEEDISFEPQKDIPHAFISRSSVQTVKSEYIPDAYAALLSAAEKGHIIIKPYEDNSPEKLRWIRETIKKEYDSALAHPEYRYFLKKHFDL
ncbi:MAG: hypothetical protein NC203_05920 [Firmicutes bacterium]|nr:hypothetical protein [[Eubacterium] siraeum]MCM1487887.1 hypothetical protein [Bacillota bacterium]